MTLPPGTRLGHYELVAAIGAGGMGEVFKARTMKRATLSIALLLFVTARAQSQSATPSATVLADVDRIFARWNSTTVPGCAVGVSRDGRPILTRAYGMADLEHGIANQPDSIIEGGSLSKQFTAAAVLLLVQQGKVALDDPGRKYIPELPDYGTPLTVRHMLTHTSGLRDWGSVEGIVGWPRTTRAYTHSHVLDIVSRQKSLNFTPGSAYSYSNTGYNLAAILVARVSGKSFQDFTREKLFEPLGMTRTSWRDDFTRVVRDRAIAYDVSSTGAVAMDMPFENVHGNGGLLTTVGDLLRWNENAVTAKVGGRGLVDLQRETMRLTGGEKIEYAFGLRVSTWKGLPEVSHSGSTAGYRAWLGQYPTKQLSVAVLCNAGNAPGTGLGHQVADLFLDTKAVPATAETPASVTDAQRREIAGLYKDRRRNDLVTMSVQGDKLLLDGGALVPAGPDMYRNAGGALISVERDTKNALHGLRIASGGETILFDRVEPARPTALDLAALAGDYSSDEAELTLRVTVENGKVVIHRRPDDTFVLTPTYADAFTSDLANVRFLRTKGVVTEMSLSVDRVWDLRFKRAATPAARPRS